MPTCATPLASPLTSTGVGRFAGGTVAELTTPVGSPAQLEAAAGSQGADVLLAPADLCHASQTAHIHGRGASEGGAIAELTSAG